MSVAEKADTASRAGRKSASGFRAPKQGPAAPAANAHGIALLTPEAIFEAHRHHGGSQVYGSPRRYMGTSLEAIARASEGRMQGAAEMLTARAYRMGHEPDHGLVFIAQGLFDEAHLLRTALWAERRRRDAEDLMEEEQRVQRRARRAPKRATKKGARS